MRPALRISHHPHIINPRAELCVHEFFQEQVASAPHRVAVVFEDQQLTFGELNARANQLAHYLVRFGVGPETLVGLCVERSLELIVGLLGILKAGGAYLPLDPGLPPARSQMILEEAGARLLVSRKELAASFLPHLEHVTCLDADAQLIAAESEDNPLSAVAAQNLVYLIFTSGSTGRPKGVAVEHRQLVNYINAIWERLDLPAGSSLATVSTIAADLGNTVVFPALCKGGTLHIIAEERTTDPASLANYFKQHQIDCVKIVPTHLSALLSTGNANILPRQRLVLGGEVCPWDLVERISSLAPACVVLNHYGPTETTVGALTNQFVKEDHRQDAATVPLGRPLANVQAYVLDHQLQLTPQGAVGELYLGGVGVARGYINRPDATAEKFIPNPFRNSGERLYQTGDLARYLEDGSIEFRGRSDYQIKIRGFRVEPAEIETVIRQHPNVRETVVLGREDERGDIRLAAYVVPNSNEEIVELSNRTSERRSQIPDTLIPDLQQLLAEKLPKHMMPSTFVMLDALPFTANGKLDRKALLSFTQSKTDLKLHYVAPRTQTEEILASIWADVLELKQIGVNDDFFKLGGHSLLAVRLFAGIEQKFGLKLPLATLFEAATISRLARVVQRGKQASWSSLVSIQPKGNRPPLFCIHACGAHVFIYRPLVAYLDLDQPVYGLQAQGIDGVQEPYTHIEDMAAHYIQEIRELQPHGPYYLLGDTLGGLIAYEMAQQLTKQGESIALLAMFDTACPLRASLKTRLLSHVRHLKQWGPKRYVLAARGVIAKRFGLRFLRYSASVQLTREEQEFADGVSASGDPVQRTEWGIYLATQVNYLPPEKPLPGKITYFLAMDNKYAEGETDNRRNWSRGAAEFELYNIAGRHNTIREEPFVAGLAEKFVSCLARAQNRGPRQQTH